MGWLREHLSAELFELGDTSVTWFTLLILLATVVVTVLAARVVRRVAMRVLTRRGPEGSAYAVARIAQYVIFVGGMALALDNVGIDLTALAAFGAVISVGIGLGLQGIAQNFVSGIILLIERPVQKGDYVVLGGTEGRVVEIEMRATRIVTRDGVAVFVPNSRLVSDEVENLSAGGPSRLRVSVGVAYGSDTRQVRDTMLELAHAHGAVLVDPEPRVLFRGFGDSSLDFELCVWLEDPAPRPAVASDLRFAIDAAFRERSITIPFPQRDLHIKSGVEELQR